MSDKISLIVNLSKTWSTLSRNNKISIHTFLTKCGVDDDENMLHNCINLIHETENLDSLSGLSELLEGFNNN